MQQSFLKIKKYFLYTIFFISISIINIKNAKAGLIPCGMDADDLSTPTIIETDPCNLCHLILTIQLIIEYLVKISAIFAVLMLVIAGFIYVFAGGKAETISKAKTVIKYSLIGFTVVFISWALVDSLLATFGFINPIGGQWHTIC